MNETFVWQRSAERRAKWLAVRWRFTVVTFSSDAIGVDTTHFWCLALVGRWTSRNNGVLYGQQLKLAQAMNRQYEVRSMLGGVAKLGW